MATGLFKSSLVKKYWMALTGIFLITFLIIHCSVNAAIFFNDGGETFLMLAHFMGTNIIIRTMEIVLVIGFLIHIVDGLMLFFQNRKARPVKYSYEKPSASSAWYARQMALLGTLLLIFLIIHASDFWIPNRVNQFQTGEELNLFEKMKTRFSELWVVILYVAACVSLFWHLLHGFKSAFQSLGFNHTKYKGTIAMVGDAFSVIVPAIFAAMPIAFYLKWIA
ncbi:MAG: succinate dehydrogenase cytochrome b subunit [Flavobacteriales bacterium]